MNDEIVYWNDVAGPRWARYQREMDRALSPLGAEALRRVAARPGEDALDIGCGCGSSSFQLAAAVGETGSVTAVDVSQPMLAVAQELRTERGGLAHLHFALADAANEAFGEGVFDLAFSQFGVMFFSDPCAAFSNLRRALRANGRLTFVCWRDLAANPWFAIPSGAVRPYALPQPAPDPEAPGPLAFADPVRVRGILERAGFEHVRFEAFDAMVSLGSHAAALDLLAHIGPASRLLEGMPEPARTDALHALSSALRENERVAEITLAGGVWIVTAKRE